MADIPKIVGQRLRAMAEVGEHPDPNLLSAFTERALGKREQVQVLEHLSRCTSCREIVSLSATEAADAGPVVAASPGWFSWPVLRWGAAVACVVVVGAAVTLHQKRESRQIVATIAEVKPAPGMQAPGLNLMIEKKAASLEVPNSEAKTAFAAKKATSQQKAVTTNLANGHYAATAPSPVEMAVGGPSPSLPDLPGRAKNAFAESRSAQAEKGTGGADLSTTETVELSAAAVSVASSAPIPANLAPRWTLSSDGTLQRSLDSGRSWETIPVSSRTTFRALAANGLDIWVGGSGGALFHSSDAGQRWMQVRPVANGEALTDDIIGVEFTDTLHGKLTSSDEESWITADAGQTWQKQ
jgi:hypothetical protein